MRIQILRIVRARMCLPRPLPHGKSTLDLRTHQGGMRTAPGKIAHELVRRIMATDGEEALCDRARHGGIRSRHERASLARTRRDRLWTLRWRARRSDTAERFPDCGPDECTLHASRQRRGVVARQSPIPPTLHELDLLVRLRD